MRYCLLVWLIACSTICPRAAVAQSTSALGKVEPPDVFLRVGTVRDELELLRHVTGRPENQQTEIGVTSAAPREVYFQAVTMFRKAERLCFEQTRHRTAEPELPVDKIGPADVLAIVDATLDCLHRVQAELGIEHRSTPATRDATKTPTDVFRSAVQANRQLNLLLEHQFAPSDVFQQVTLGIGYASRLLETFPAATTIPDAPKFESGKRPGDVYRRLLDCFARIRRIAKASDLPMLELEADKLQIAKAEPSDVYDVASLLVSELAFIHAQLADADPPRPVYFVGRKFPSHVYQRAGILERQLIELEKQIEEGPQWLTDQGSMP